MSEEVDSTWKQMERHVRNNGFREGASKGLEDATLVGFNEGFADGFKLGSALGTKKGILAAKKVVLATGDDCKISDYCEICIRQQNNSEINVTYDELKTNQELRSNEVINLYIKSSKTS